MCQRRARNQKLGISKGPARKHGGLKGSCITRSGCQQHGELVLPQHGLAEQEPKPDQARQNWQVWAAASQGKRAEPTDGRLVIETLHGLRLQLATQKQ